MHGTSYDSTPWSENDKPNIRPLRVEFAPRRCRRQMIWFRRIAEPAAPGCTQPSQLVACHVHYGADFGRQDRRCPLSRRFGRFTLSSGRGGAPARRARVEPDSDIRWATTQRFLSTGPSTSSALRSLPRAAGTPGRRLTRLPTAHRPPIEARARTRSVARGRTYADPAIDETPFVNSSVTVFSPGL
jgi:hypothetical protein